MDKEILLYEYEQILLKNKATFSPYYFKCAENLAEANALYIMKFAVEKYLRWSPQVMRHHFSADVCRQMKLEQLCKYIEFPPELDKSSDYFYYAAKIYPGQVRVDVKDLTLQTYKRVLDGSLCKFPKEYLSGVQGLYKAGMCLQYMLNTYCSFASIREMYEYFTDSRAVKLLKKYRLSAICSEIYDHPIDYLHESLPDEQKDDFWYFYYRFKSYSQAQSAKKKKETAKIIT